MSEMPKLLFEPYLLGNIVLKNRIVMAPMTRNRSIGNLPNKLVAEYYEQRAGAGLIITEGTAPSPNGLGYANIPGIFNEEQVEAWKKTTNAVHDKGGRIFVQLMHTGRMGYPQNLPEGAELLGPSAIAAMGKVMKNTQRTNNYHTPREMTIDDIAFTIQEFVQAGVNAINAGFDGVELHGANEHLIEQFLSPGSNQRVDEYGGSYVNRCRFALELAEAVGNAIGFDKVGIRLSPYGVNNEIPVDEMDATYGYLTKRLNQLGLVYIHHVDHSAMGGNEVPDHLKQLIRENFKNAIILTGGFDHNKAEATLQSGLADLIAFGRPYISNPDLAERMKKGWPINGEIDIATLYTSEAKGYTDYKTFQT